jgi:hypothetical protein
MFNKTSKLDELAATVMICEAHIRILSKDVRSLSSDVEALCEFLEPSAKEKPNDPGSARIMGSAAEKRRWLSAALDHARAMRRIEVLEEDYPELKKS